VPRIERQHAARARHAFGIEIRDQESGIRYQRSGIRYQIRVLGYALDEDPFDRISAACCSALRL